MGFGRDLDSLQLGNNKSLRLLLEAYLFSQKFGEDLNIPHVGASFHPQHQPVPNPARIFLIPR
jgi:hypothetical protein